MTYYNYIDFYPQGLGMSFEFSFKNYDNFWTGCIDFVSSGINRPKLKFESGKVFNEDNEFLCPINTPYAGETSNNINIYSGNIFNNRFNLFLNKIPVFESKNKNYAPISGIEIYSNNNFWDADGINLQIGGREIPGYRITYRSSGSIGDQLVPIKFSGLNNRYPIKIFSVTLGYSENNTYSNLFQHMFFSGSPPSYTNPIIIKSGEEYIFNLIKRDPSIPLQGEIPIYMSTNFGNYFEALPYRDFEKISFEQSSNFEIGLSYYDRTTLRPIPEFSSDIAFSLFNTSEYFSGFTIFLSGVAGNNECDNSVCDSFFTSWSLYVNGQQTGVFSIKNTDFPVITNYTSNGTQGLDNTVGAALYTGGYTGQSEYIPDISISKNIFAPGSGQAFFGNITGVGMTLYNSQLSTGAIFQVKIFESDYWNSLSGYSVVSGTITPNINKLVYSENINLLLTTFPTYYPIKFTGSVNLTGSKNYSFVFSAYTTSGEIYWPKTYTSNYISGTPYYSNIGYIYTGGQVSYNSGVISGNYNSYISTSYNNAFEINPASTRINTLFANIDAFPSTPNQFFDIQIKKSMPSNNYTGAASFLITGYNLLRTGTVGITKDIFRNLYGFIY